MVEEIHHLHQSVLGLVLAGHIREGLSGLGLDIYLGIGLAKAHGIACPHAAHELLGQ